MRTITQKLAFLLMALWCCVGVPQFVIADDECIVIGEGTSANSSYIPIASWYHNAYSQQLFLASEIDHDAANITSIAFAYNVASETTRSISIYMANTNATSLSSGYVTSGLVEVLPETVVTFNNDKPWVVITLETPFAYDGNSNLVVAVYMNYSSSETNYDSGSRFLTHSATGMTRYQTNDTPQSGQIALGSNFVPTSGGSSHGYRCNTQICFAESVVACAKPDSIVATGVAVNDATLTWGGGSGLYNVEYKSSADAAWTSLLSNTALQRA